MQKIISFSLPILDHKQNKHIFHGAHYIPTLCHPYLQDFLALIQLLASTYRVLEHAGVRQKL